MQFFFQFAMQFYSQEMLVSEECLTVESTLAKCNEGAYLRILRYSRVELHCKLQEKFHRATAPSAIKQILFRKLLFFRYNDFVAKNFFLSFLNHWKQEQNELFSTYILFSIFPRNK